MQKKIFMFLALILFLVNVNAIDYETTVQISTIDNKIYFDSYTNGFYHWVTLDWTYTGPTAGDTSWMECDFERPDKNYGIFFDTGSAIATNSEIGSDNTSVSIITDPITGIIDDFGPITSQPLCDDYGSYAECTARTTYFVKMSNEGFIIDTNISIPMNIRGKCGVTDADFDEEEYEPNQTVVGNSHQAGVGATVKRKEKINDSKILFSFYPSDPPNNPPPASLYPIDLYYDYNFTVNHSYSYLGNQDPVVPDVNITTRWGKLAGFGSPESFDAVLEVEATDLKGKDIVGIDWIYPADCTLTPTSTIGMDTPDLESTADFDCQNPGIKLLVVYVTNEDGFVRFEPFLSYFSSNNQEIEFDYSFDEQLGLPNVTEFIDYNEITQHVNYRLSKLYSKTQTIVKDVGNGFAEDNDFYEMTNTDSTPFVTVIDPICAQLGNQGKNIYEGEDFKIINHYLYSICEPGNHEIKINATGIYTNGNNYNFSEDFNFVVLDININVLNLKVNDGTGLYYLGNYSSVYGMIFGEDGIVDLNIIIDNYSPTYTGINDTDLGWLAGSFWLGSSGDSCPSETTTITEVDPTTWKIDSHLECETNGWFVPIIEFTDLPEYFPRTRYMLWVTEPIDKFKMDSITIENLGDNEWNPDTNEICNPKTGSCANVYSHNSSNLTGIVVLPEDIVKIHKGDLLRFHSTVTNVYFDGLNANLILVITDSKGNVAATIAEERFGPYGGAGYHIGPSTKYLFNILFFDTDFLKENELYTATATVYWYPNRGFNELDAKPVNNTKIIHFYVLGPGLATTLPETNFVSVILALFFVVLILRKK